MLRYVRYGSCSISDYAYGNFVAHFKKFGRMKVVYKRSGRELTFQDDARSVNCEIIRNKHTQKNLLDRILTTTVTPTLTVTPEI